MAENSIDEQALAALDAEYIPLPDFSSWPRLEEGLARWDEPKAALEDVKSQAASEVYAAAVEFTLRAAAVDTGAIEGLYEVDRGFTYSVAVEAATWEAEADKRNVDIRRFFDAQLVSFRLVLDAATGRTPISEAWIRTLHEQICEPQDTYQVKTPVGLQEHKLPKGEYKVYPNHVLDRQGRSFSYAPVKETAAEMRRFTAELSSDAFAAAHPILQASYSHYALVKAHPFADGNGRVARALASVYLYRAVSVPLIVFADQRREYFDALSKADDGELEAFQSFIFERTVDAMLIQMQRLEALAFPPADQSASELDSLYETYRGFRHFELDDAAYRIAVLAHSRFQEGLKHLAVGPEIARDVSLASVNYGAGGEIEGYRSPIKNQGRRIVLKFSSQPPADASVGASFDVYVSKHESDEAELLLVSPHGYGRFRSRIDEVYPSESHAFEIRLSFWVDRVIRQILDSLKKQARESLESSGYS